MGIIREIHNAYGIDLKGEYREYYWYDGRVDDVIWEIYVNDKKVYLGNAFFIISKDETGTYINMEKDKDLLCYWLSKQNYDLYNLEQFFMKEYSSCLWRHRAQQMKLKEAQNVDNIC